jgi:hypothetical protein
MYREYISYPLRIKDFLSLNSAMKSAFLFAQNIDYPNTSWERFSAGSSQTSFLFDLLMAGI